VNEVPLCTLEDNRGIALVTCCFSTVVEITDVSVLKNLPAEMDD